VRRALSPPNPSFARAQSLTVNSLYNSLKRKADQLKDAGGTGHRVIVACDGASGSLRYQTAFGREEHSPARIAKRFLQEHTVAAVCLVTAGRGNVGPLKVRTEVVTHPGVLPADAESIRGVLNALPARLPQVESDALNALIHLRVPGRRVGRSFFGGLKMSASRVTVSARAVQQLLAGQITHEEFRKPYGGSSPDPVTMFAAALKAGRLIESVSIEHCPDRDDDWLTFRFSNGQMAGRKVGLASVFSTICSRALADCLRRPLDATSRASLLRDNPRLSAIERVRLLTPVAELVLSARHY